MVISQCCITPRRALHFASTAVSKSHRTSSWGVPFSFWQSHFGLARTWFRKLVSTHWGQYGSLYQNWLGVAYRKHAKDGGRDYEFDDLHYRRREKFSLKREVEIVVPRKSWIVESICWWSYEMDVESFEGFWEVEKWKGKRDIWGIGRPWGLKAYLSVTYDPSKIWRDFISSKYVDEGEIAFYCIDLRPRTCLPRLSMADHNIVGTLVNHQSMIVH